MKNQQIEYYRINPDLSVNNRPNLNNMVQNLKIRKTQTNLCQQSLQINNCTEFKELMTSRTQIYKKINQKIKSQNQTTNNDQQFKYKFSRQDLKSQNCKRTVRGDRYFNDHYNNKSDRQRLQSSKYFRVSVDKNKETDSQFQQTFKNYAGNITASEKDNIDLFNSLKQTNQKLEDQFNKLCQKMQKFDEVQEMLFVYEHQKQFKDQQLSHFYQALKKLSDEIQDQVKMQMKSIEIQNLQKKVQKQQDMIEFLKKENEFYKQNRNFQGELITLQKKQILNKSTVIKAQDKKYSQLNEKLEFVLESDLYDKMDNPNKMMISLQDQLKINRKQEIDIKRKVNDYQQLYDQNKKLEDSIQKYKQIIKVLKKKENPNLQFIGRSNENLGEKLILDLAQLPESMSFLNVGQNIETINLVNELVDNGVSMFMEMNQMEKLARSSKNQKSSLEGILEQFLNDRMIFSRLNRMMQKLLDMKEIENTRDLQNYMKRELKEYIFNCDNICLWIVDGQTGLLQGGEIKDGDKMNVQKIFMDQGVVGDSVQKKRSYITNQSQRMIYQKMDLFGEKQQKSEVYMGSSIISPIVDSGQQVIAVVEISNYKENCVGENGRWFGVDDGYLVLVMKLYIKQKLDQIVQIQNWKAMDKFSQQIQKTGIEILDSSDQLELTRIVQRFLRDSLKINQF